MSIDWSHFTPWASLAGGLLIGSAAAMLILLNGRIAGISRILGGMLHTSKGDFPWRLAFLAGLVIAPLIYALAAPLPAVRFDADGVLLVVSGLLVGFGTRCGSGCTSGHGVCGLSRLSLRSLVATGCFMLAGFATVFVIRHLIA